MKIQKIKEYTCVGMKIQKIKEYMRRYENSVGKENQRVIYRIKGSGAAPPPIGKLYPIYIVGKGI